VKSSIATPDGAGLADGHAGKILSKDSVKTIGLTRLGQFSNF